jgi:hypothetical protein
VTSPIIPADPNWEAAVLKIAEAAGNLRAAAVLMRERTIEYDVINGNTSWRHRETLLDSDIRSSINNTADMVNGLLSLVENAFREWGVRVDAARRAIEEARRMEIRQMEEKLKSPPDPVAPKSGGGGAGVDEFFEQMPGH